jgi:hypothetical protein
MAKKDKKIHADLVLINIVKQLADDLGVPESQIWNFFVAEGLINVQDEESSIWKRLKPSKSNRYKKNLDYDDLLRRLKGEDD